MSQTQMHDGWAALDYGKASVSTSTQFQVKSKCYAVHPVQKTDSRYSVIPFRERIYISSQQGELLVIARKVHRVKPGTTLVITACGDPKEAVAWAGNDALPKQIFAAAGIGGILAVPRDSISSETPDSANQ
ncbi:MAG TPA: hypothetical protein VN577_04780 [Terriglobales bacterium]|nr:hypothetical protein [Terriglobales bacterium]